MSQLTHNRRGFRIGEPTSFENIDPGHIARGRFWILQQLPAMDPLEIAPEREGWKLYAVTGTIF